MMEFGTYTLTIEYKQLGAVSNLLNVQANSTFDP